MYSTLFRNIIKHTAQCIGVAGEIEQVGVLIVSRVLVQLRTTVRPGGVPPRIKQMIK